MVKFLHVSLDLNSKHHDDRLHPDILPYKRHIWPLSYVIVGGEVKMYPYGRWMRCDDGYDYWGPLVSVLPRYHSFLDIRRARR